MLERPIINTSVQVLGKVMTVFCGIITTSILVKYLGVWSYGNYTLIVSVFLLIDVVADFGTRIIGVRELSKMPRDKKSEMFNQIWWLRIIMMSIAFLIGLNLMMFLPSIKNLKIEAGIVLLICWLTMMAGSMEILFWEKMRMEMKVIGEVLYPIIILIGLLVLNNKLNLILVFEIVFGARVLSLVPALIINRKELLSLKLRANKKVLWGLIKLSWPMGLYLLIFTSYDRAIDSLFIERYWGARAVGQYGLGYKIYSALLQPAYFFVSSIFPLLSKSNKDRRVLIKKARMLMVVGGAMMMGLVYLTAPLMIRIISSNNAEFGISITVLRVLSMAMFFSYLGHLWGFNMIAEGKQKRILMIGIINIVLYVIASYLLVPRYGILGSAGITVGAEALSFGLMVMWKRKG